MRCQKGSASIVMMELLAFGLAIGACGKDDKKDDSDALFCTDGEACLGKGVVTVVKDSVATIDLSEADKDSQYVVLPFVLGDTATVEGGGAETFTFSVATATSGGEELHGGRLFWLKERPAATAARAELESGHGQRFLHNRFSESYGQDQGAWFWKLAADLDQSLDRGSSPEGVRGRSQPDSISGYFRSTLRHTARRDQRAATATRAVCPASVPMPNPESPTGDLVDTAVDAENLVADDDFCIAYLDDPATESDKDRIKATVTTVMERFQLMYGTALASARPAYQFKPVIVIVDFADTDKWPAVKPWQIAGAFIRRMSEAAGQPMIYLPADLGEVDGNYDGNADGGDEEANRVIWHGVIAHEMQHAIINYLRVQKGGGEDEVPALDEGLAHTMESVFGHGMETFTGFAKSFLDVWALTQPSFLHASESANVNRGGAQTLLYYLASQKGGVNFEDGVVKDGGGLDFLVALVSDASKRGPSNLFDKFGGEPVEVIGSYLAALVVDGTGLKGAPNEFKCQDPNSAIKNLLAQSGKTFGMHFNNFAELPEIGDYSAADAVADGANSKEFGHYATAPMVFVTGDGGAKLQFTFSDAAQKNIGVTTVRIK